MGENRVIKLTFSPTILRHQSLFDLYFHDLSHRTTIAKQNELKSQHAKSSSSAYSTHPQTHTRERDGRARGELARRCSEEFHHRLVLKTKQRKSLFTSFQNNCHSEMHSRLGGEKGAKTIIHPDAKIGSSSNYFKSYTASWLLLVLCLNHVKTI